MTDTQTPEVPKEMTAVKKHEDTYSYKGWLNSDNFWKRVFGVLGYQLVGQIAIGMIGFVLIAVPLLLMFLAMGSRSL